MMMGMMEVGAYYQHAANLKCCGGSSPVFQSGFVTDILSRFESKATSEHKSRH